MSANTRGSRNGSIITFYSYKGGTGRSMALANVAWLLANSGQRVLAIDWDLEAPGLHRYFEPFLTDKSLQRSTGLIDFVREFATAALSVGRATDDPGWFEQYANLLTHAMPIEWEFPAKGCLDFVPAGKQDAAYAIRVNSFDWQQFYERLGGGVLLEAVKRNLRELYDFVLIDSRTGVSDTSGVCTVQMPDQLVVCFTLNRQSIYGASAAARSAFKQRHKLDGTPTLKVWPVPTRVDSSEKDRLEVAQTIARARFSGLQPHLNPEQEDAYWGEIPVHYEAYYAYEEVLASFRDRPRQTGSMLAKMETIARHLADKPLASSGLIDESRKAIGLAAFTSRLTADCIEELEALGVEYETIRRTMRPGAERTNLMTLLVERAQLLSGGEAGAIAEELFRRGTAGARVVGLALARKQPQRRHIEMTLAGIATRESPFEQYHALQLAAQLLPVLEPSAGAQLQSAIQRQVLEGFISPDDPSRWNVAQQILNALSEQTLAAWIRAVSFEEAELRNGIQEVVDCRPASPHILYDDAEESHGPFVVTRGRHQLRITGPFRMARYPVTHELFQRFVAAGGYEENRYWRLPFRARQQFTTADGSSLGPASWPDACSIPAGKEQHPVSGVSFLEALAFIQWCNDEPTEGRGWHWGLPLEDHWEYAARAEAGLTYPWGDAFDADRCNSSEMGVGGTTAVTQFEAGASPVGCCDMAGNVWEFVSAADAGSNWCVLRGGSFKNNRFEVRSYLRLMRVPNTHRAPDFGFRLAQTR